MKPTLVIMAMFYLVLSGSAEEPAPLVLPVWVSDHMILPSSMSCTFRGQAEPGAVVSVQFSTFVLKSTVDRAGAWSIETPPFPRGLKGELIFCVGEKKKVLADVVTGDIWVCSGQSNMLRPVSSSVDGAAALEDVHKADVRFFDGKKWILASSENVGNLSAVPFFFAVEMAHRQQAPVGVFVAASGGTGIEAWVPVSLFPDTKIGRKMRPLVTDPEVLKASKEDRADIRQYGQHRLARWGLGRAVPSMLFENMVKPFGDLPVRGVVWYQGESNADTLIQAQEYDQWLESLIHAYRNLWNDLELPFVIVQLPEYDPGEAELQEAWAVVQQMQMRVTAITEKSVLVDIHDLGDLKDIHPRRKKEVGQRTSAAACSLISE